MEILAFLADSSVDVEYKELVVACPPSEDAMVAARSPSSKARTHRVHTQFADSASNGRVIHRACACVS